MSKISGTIHASLFFGFIALINAASYLIHLISVFILLHVLQVMHKFKAGGYNTLISTCVGEEGLDIGEVDLIVCFDAHKSPIRLVQRMGRTGRQREGRIVMLVTEGKEHAVRVVNMDSRNSGVG
jgi:excinuclease UvrABC helicase subunit UvrB